MPASTFSAPWKRGAAGDWQNDNSKGQQGNRQDYLMLMGHRRHNDGGGRHDG